MIERKHENNFLQVKIENFEKKNCVCVFLFFKIQKFKNSKNSKNSKNRRRCF